MSVISPDRLKAITRKIPIAVVRFFGSKSGYEWDFVACATLLAQDMNENAHDKGFYDESRTFGDECALLHSEVSEMLEAFRHGNPESEKIPGFTCIEEEKADALIRILETAYEHGERVPEAVLAKMEYNRTRPHRHGGKKL